MQILSHYTIAEGIAYSNSICRITENQVKVIPYSEEIAGTVFINGIVVVDNKDLTSLAEGINKILCKNTSNPEKVRMAAELIQEHRGELPELSAYHYFTLDI